MSSSNADWNIDITLTNIQEEIRSLNLKITLIINILLQPDLRFNNMNDDDTISSQTNESSNNSSSSSTKSSSSSTHKICWFQRKFGSQANKCASNCKFQKNLEN